MAYTFEKLPGAPIIVFTAFMNSDFSQDMTDSYAEGAKLLDAQPEPTFMICDLTRLSISLGDLLQAAELGAAGAQSPLYHANIRENVFVSADPLIKMAIRGLSSATFGQMQHFSRFDTLAQAVDYCRQLAGAPG